MATATATATAYSTQASYLASIEANVRQDLLAAYEKFSSGESAFSRDFGLEYGKAIWHACQKLKEAKYGQLSQFLDNLGIPRSTAYRWMDAYEISIGTKQAKPAKEKQPVGAVEVEPATVEPVEVEPVEVEPDLDIAAVLADVTDSPAFEPIAEPSPAVSLSGEVQESQTTKLRKLFEGTGLLLKPSRVDDGLKSCTNKFNVFGLTAKQVTAVAKVLHG
jgi:hypothetical protein